MRLAALVRAAGYAFAMVLAGIAGCSSPPKAANCPEDTPTSCPSPPPSWKTDVQPIVVRRCVSCHSPTGVESVLNYTDFKVVETNATEMGVQVSQCVMPPSTAGQPTAAERAILLAWFLPCRAPNN